MAHTYKTYNRYYCAVLYTEDVNFVKYKTEIEKRFTEVTYIKHDKDRNEDGTLKKEHIHIMFRVGKNARRINSVAEDIGIPVNYLEGCNKDNMLLYLIHYKKQEKYQYNVEEVQGELKERLKELLEDNKTENQKLKEIIEAIRKKEIVTYRDLVIYGIENKCAETIRKYSYILCKCI